MQYGKKAVLVLMLALVLCFFAATQLVYASPKSIYLVADHHASPTPINAYNINPDGTLGYQATYSVTSLGIGASGLAMYDDPNGDSDYSDAQIFVTYESSNTIEVFNAVDLSTVGSITASGASDLAGIVVDQGNTLVYTVDRWTQNLYVYDANTFAPVGTLPIVLSTLSNKGTASFPYEGAIGLALDETNGWLYVTDCTPTVHIFDTSSWTEIGTITTDSNYAISIAVDVDLGIVYTGGGFYTLTGYGSWDCLLAKYDLATSTATSIDLEAFSGIYQCGAIGLAVDPDTNRLYVTTGYGGDDLRVFDSGLNQVYLYPDTEGMILNPAGICIPGKEYAYGLLNLEKDDGLAAGEFVPPGGTITYTISFDNTMNLFDVHNVVLVDDLPPETDFVSASGGGTYNSGTHQVTWNIGDLAAGATTVSVTLVVTVKPGTPCGTIIRNYATINADEPGTGPTTRYVDTEVNIPEHVIPEVPLGTVMASMAMIIALLGYFGIPKFRKRII